MFVATRMTKHPLTVEPSATLNEAAKIMKTNHFHRLPVVENGKLVGYFSDRDLMRVSPSPATTLSRYKVRELLDKLTVREIMKKDVVTVQESATIEEAALIMYNHKVGGLAVISDVGMLVGIITATDILKTFVDLMELKGGKTRLTIEVDDKVGVVHDIAGVFVENGLSIDSLITCREDSGKYEIVVRGDVPDEEDLKKKIEQKGYHVVHTVKIG
ncbi:MAG: CBS domain-containing protein [Selenomonadaceae bacterium]|nr:CBS domain-containing protein [Selenomonadaceae bacterium]